MGHRAQLKVSDTQTIWLLFSESQTDGRKRVTSFKNYYFYCCVLLKIFPPTKWEHLWGEGNFGEQSPDSQCLPSILCNFGPNGFPQLSRSAIKRTNKGGPTRSSALALGSWPPQLCLRGNPLASSFSRLLGQFPRLLHFYSAKIHGSHSRLEKSEPLSSPTCPKSLRNMP